MNCLVLQTSEGKHLGFILCHFNDGAKMGDCVFSIIPTDPSLFDDETTHLLFTRKNIGESTIQIDADPPRILRVRSPGLPVMVISLDENGLGEWGEETTAGVQGRGKALIPKPTKKPWWKFW